MEGEAVKQMGTKSVGEVDTEKFRLRRFVDTLAASGELETHDEAIDLIDMAEILNGHPKAVLFCKVGPEGAGADRQTSPAARSKRARWAWHSRSRTG